MRSVIGLSIVLLSACQSSLPASSQPAACQPVVVQGPTRIIQVPSTSSTAGELCAATEAYFASGILADARAATGADPSPDTGGSEVDFSPAVRFFLSYGV